MDILHRCNINVFKYGKSRQFVRSLGSFFVALHFIRMTKNEQKYGFYYCRHNDQSALIRFFCVYMITVQRE